MTALMKDAIKPNLVQTLEGTPCLDARRSVRQYRARLQQRAWQRKLALKLGDYCHHGGRLRR